MIAFFLNLLQYINNRTPVDRETPISNQDKTRYGLLPMTSETQKCDPIERVVQLLREPIREGDDQTSTIQEAKPMNHWFQPPQ